MSDFFVPSYLIISEAKAQTQLIALTIIEAGAAGSFLLVTFLLRKKKSDNIALAIPETGKR